VVKPGKRPGTRSGARQEIAQTACPCDLRKVFAKFPGVPLYTVKMELPIAAFYRAAVNTL
jgi:hypothetical protein